MTTTACSIGYVCERYGGSACADPNWAEWPMPNSQQDVNNGAPNLEIYHDNGDGTVTDNVTGLMWQQTVSTMNYPPSSAATYCTALTVGGHSDWRVPSLVELISIVDYDSSSPAIPPGTFFGSTPSTAVFLSSTPFGGSTSQMGAVTISTGETGPATMANVRCVR
jgi:hypothetical protein